MFFIYSNHIFSGFNCIKEFCYLIIVIFCWPTKEQIVRLKIHHGGMFIYYPFTVYINGQIVEEEWGWDVDTMSYIDFKKLIKSLGYKSFKCLWYRDPPKST